MRCSTWNLRHRLRNSAGHIRIHHRRKLRRNNILRSMSAVGDFLLLRRVAHCCALLRDSK